MINNNFTWLFVIFCLCTLVNCAKFPTEIEKCSYGDVECIKKQINTAVKVFAKGNSKLNLVPLDPIEIDGFEIVQGGNSPINLAISFKNAKTYGVSNAKIIRVSGFPENPDGAKNEVQYTAPSFSLVGDYKANGQILVLPITGNGRANLTMVNPVVTFKCTTKAVEKDGEIYAEIVKAKFVYNSMDKLLMQFDDLFQTEQQLTENINNFLNDNWKLIFEELKPKIGEIFADITSQMINNVFVKRPYKEFFKQD